MGAQDTYSKFYTDLEEYQTISDTPDPAVWLRCFYSTEASQKENKWQGRNISRWQSKEYDEAWDKQQYELDPIKRAQLLIECNDLACRNHVVLPIVYRPIVVGIRNNLHAKPSGFESQIGSLPNWYREG